MQGGWKGVGRMGVWADEHLHPSVPSWGQVACPSLLVFCLSPSQTLELFGGPLCTLPEAPRPPPGLCHRVLRTFLPHLALPGSCLSLPSSPRLAGSCLLFPPGVPGWLARGPAQGESSTIGKESRAGQNLPGARLLHVHSLLAPPNLTRYRESVRSSQQVRDLKVLKFGRAGGVGGSGFSPEAGKEAQRGVGSHSPLTASPQP